MSRRLSKSSALFWLPLVAKAASLSPRSCNVEIGYDVYKVADQASLLSTHSWEYGTAAEAFLELYNPEYSVFGNFPFPGNGLPTPDPSIYSLKYAKPLISLNETTFIDGDGAVGDPASLGVSALLLGQTNQAYFEASQRESNYITDNAPRYWNGAISQRNDTPDLWADWSYMAPPFLAYNAVATGNTTLLKEAISQFTLQRQILLDNTTESYHGLWEHIVGPSDTQPQLWSTGNGWVAAGMARVLATTQKWGSSADWVLEQNMLKQYIKEIIDGAMNTSKDDGLLRNYLNETTWFGETSGTALLTSVVYRMAVEAPEIFNDTYISWADSNRIAVAAHVNGSGILSPAVNPLSWGDESPYTDGSPEGQSFGMLLYAAYRDCVCKSFCK